jgi:transposase-like protein
LHGKHVAPEMLVWAVRALAGGLGIRAVARVFEVDPNTVLAWLSEVANHGRCGRCAETILIRPICLSLNGAGR